MVYRNVLIGKPLVEPWELIALDEDDWENNEKGYTLFTNTRFLPAVLKEAGIVSSTREVRRNRPDLCKTFADDYVGCLDIKMGKKKLWVVVGDRGSEAYQEIMDRIDRECESKTVRDIFEDFTFDEKSAVYSMVGCVLDHGKVDFDILGDGIRATYYGFTKEQKKAVDLIIEEACK